MAKRPIRRPTEESALARVMRDQKRSRGRVPKGRNAGDQEPSPQAREMAQILNHSHDPRLLAQARAFFGLSDEEEGDAADEAG